MAHPESGYKRNGAADFENVFRPGNTNINKIEIFQLILINSKSECYLKRKSDFCQINSHFVDCIIPTEYFECYII